METNVNYTLVGTFVIILIAAIALSVIWLSSGFSFAQNSTYLVYMQEAVTGLNIDSPVEYNGVSVGVIKSVEINRKNPRLVELQLSIKDGTPITQGTVATLDARGLTGITYIQLKDKGTHLKPLKAQKGDPYPVIPTSPSLFTRLDTLLTTLSNNFGEVAQSIKTILNPENQRLIKSILTNTSRASGKLAPLIESSAGTMNTLQTQTMPATYQLLNNLDNMSRSLSALSQQIKQNPSILIRGAAPTTLGPGETR